MKKFLNFLKIKKDDGALEEDQKHSEDEHQ